MQSASADNRGSVAGTSIGLITNFFCGRNPVSAGNCSLWIKVLLPTEVGPLIIQSICDFLGQLEPWPRVRIFSEQRFRTKDPRALRLKKLSQLGREERGTVRPRIKIEKQAAVLVQKSRPNVVDKKFPIGSRPFDTIPDATDPVET